MSTSIRTFHHRQTSDELDVFEATWYFSEFNEPVSSKKEEEKHEAGAQEEEPGESALTVRKFSKGKSSQPTSPGGRLARILNNFFNQKKKKSELTRILSTGSIAYCSSGSSSPDCKSNQRTPRKYSENVKRLLGHRCKQMASLPRLAMGGKEQYSRREKSPCISPEEEIGSDSSSDLFELQNYDVDLRDYL